MKKKVSQTKPALPGADSAIAAPLGVDIQTAAQLVGVSRAQFYRLYLKSGRLRAVKTGGRDRVIDYGELTAAYKALRDELPRVEQAA